jgi:hypothetical protein
MITTAATLDSRGSRPHTTPCERSPSPEMGAWGASGWWAVPRVAILLDAGGLQQPGAMGAWGLWKQAELQKSARESEKK